MASRTKSNLAHTIGRRALSPLCQACLIHNFTQPAGLTCSFSVYFALKGFSGYSSLQLSSKLSKSVAWFAFLYNQINFKLVIIISQELVLALIILRLKVITLEIT